MLSLDIKAIGSVRDSGDGRFVLRLLPAYADGLHGVNAGDRIQVLYWMHELTHADRRSLLVHPRGDENVSLRGVFSLRSPMRPNPIGVTEVNVVEVRDVGLLVSGLDARDGSPIIDIKAVCR